MSKKVKLHLGLIYFDLYDENVDFINNLTTSTLLYKVCDLLEREMHPNIEVEVYNDKTKDLIFTNVILKTDVQTINIQIIPDIYVVDDKDESLKDNRVHLLKQTLLEYGKSIINICKDSDKRNDILHKKVIINTPDYIIVKHWNQLPIKFE